MVINDGIYDHTGWWFQPTPLKNSEINGKDDNPYMKWKKKPCLKPPTSSGWDTPIRIYPLIFPSIYLNPDVCVQIPSLSTSCEKIPVDHDIYLP